VCTWVRAVQKRHGRQVVVRLVDPQSLGACGLSSATACAGTPRFSLMEPSGFVGWESDPTQPSPAPWPDAGNRPSPGGRSGDLATRQPGESPLTAFPDCPIAGMLVAAIMPLTKERAVWSPPSRRASSGNCRGLPAGVPRLLGHLLLSRPPPALRPADSLGPGEAPASAPLTARRTSSPNHFTANPPWRGEGRQERRLRRSGSAAASGTDRAGRVVRRVEMECI